MLFVLMFAGYQQSFARDQKPVVSISPSLGLAGSASNINTLFSIGIKSGNSSHSIAFKYSYLVKITGGFLSSHKVFYYRERGLLYLRGFYTQQAIILLGSGITSFIGQRAYQDTRSESIAFPVELRIITRGQLIGIGLSFYGSLNGEYSYVGGGINLCFGRLH